MALSHSPSIVTDGLVLCLDAANRKSYPGTGTGWTDLSFNNFTGVLTNGVTFGNQNFGNFVFDGTDDRVLVPSWNYTLGTGGFSTNIWFKTSGTSEVNQVLFVIRRDSDDFQQFGFNIGSNILTGAGSTKKIALWNYAGPAGSGGANVLSNSDVVTGQWINLCGTRTSLTTKIYINGILDAERTVATSTNINVLNPLTIASSNISGTGLPPFSGNIAYFQCYNKELSNQEISQNFNALRGRFGI